MRKLKFSNKMNKILFSLFIVSLLFSLFVLTAFATEAPPVTEPVTAEPTQIVTAEPTQPPQTEPATLAPQTQAKTEYYEETEEIDYPKEELPTVKKAEVETATTVKIPDVEVSDATLLYGVISWLCVALGIAAVVGVLVSKRTHQKRVD